MPKKRNLFKRTHGNYEYDGYNNASLDELFIGPSKYLGRSKHVRLVLSFMKSVNNSTEEKQSPTRGDIKIIPHHVKSRDLSNVGEFVGILLYS